MITHLKTIDTRNGSGELTGSLTPIWHVDSGIKVDQVYLTSIAMGCVKGPHLHKIRAGAFTVIAGHVLIVTRVEGEYIEYDCWDGDPMTIHVPPGTPCALYNVGGTEALVLNMPTPPWRDNSDEHAVEGWTYEVEA